MDALTLTDKKVFALIKSIPACKTITIKGNGKSMSPFIKTGDILFIKPVNPSDRIHVGNVVAVTDPVAERIIIHRVVHKKKDWFKIKGDNCRKSDGWFSKSRIAGVMIQKRTTSGKLVYSDRARDVIIAWFSKTGLLNAVVLPLGRQIKQMIKR